MSRKMRDNRTPDQNAQKFITSVRAPGLRKKLFAGYIEGFYAADLTKIGEAGIALAEHADSGSLNENDTFRPLPDYTQFLKSLLKVPEEKIRFHSTVTAIHWSAEGVETLFKDSNGDLLKMPAG